MSHSEIALPGHDRYDVVIAGAGPVGLTAALVLGQAGRHVLVLEAETQPATQWRASTFHPPTLELCEELGLVEEMLAQGLIAPTYQLRDRNAGIIAEFDFTAIADSTRYPFRLQLEQYKYVRLLLDRLDAIPTVEVRYGCRVTAHRATGAGVAVDIRSDVEPATSVGADYLVGADGARSTVRRVLGIPFEGSTYEHRYLLLGIDAPLERYWPDISHVNYVADPVEHLMLLRIPDVWRVMFEVAEGPSDDEVLGDDFIARRLRSLLGSRPLPVLRSRQLYRVHQRVAATFLDGAVALIGDAAHVNSPIGGMGLNSGIHDAYTLAHALTGTGLSDLRSPLVEWAEQRRNIALTEIQRITHRSTSDLSERDPERRAARVAQLRDIAADPARARTWMLEASMITSARAQSLVPTHLIAAAQPGSPPVKVIKHATSAAGHHR